MATIDPWTSPTALGAGESTASTFMAKVYRWMAAGLAITGAVAYGVANSEAAREIVFQRPVMWGLFFGQLLMVFLFNKAVRTASFGTVAAMFVAYCALIGVFISSAIYVYTAESVSTTFFITGGTFLAMSAYGTLTKKDLSSWGQFLGMGFVGVFIACIVNAFIHSDGLGFIISCAGVLVFTGLTAYHTQKIRAFADAGDDRLALNGALMLYLDFINLFLMLLRFTSRRR